MDISSAIWTQSTLLVAPFKIDNLTPTASAFKAKDAVPKITSANVQLRSSDEFSHNRLLAKQAYLGQAKEKEQSEATTSQNAALDGEELSAQEQQEIKELKDRDAEVRAHEQAHQSSGGQYASAPVYDYERGPDGKDYAIGGHVNIDVSKEDTPEKTLVKMEQIISAARAPADPSSQDLKVATQAQQMAAQARAKIASTNQDDNDDDPQDRPTTFSKPE